MRLAAVGDLHCTRAGCGALGPLLSRVTSTADVLALCGDLTETGLPDEARVLAGELAAIKIPIVAVLGNHDYESGEQDQVRTILTDAGVCVLDGSVCEFGDVGFAGVKGFCGGFGQRALEPWGEGAIKAFVRESVEEALKLESALAKLRSSHRIALLHYAPIEATVEGEALEVYPFLGSSRLEEPLNRYQVTAAFHGHAHHGRMEGRTREGLPVFNVCLPLLRGTFGEHSAVRLVEIPSLSPLSHAG